jgi:hypothetical protein
MQSALWDTFESIIQCLKITRRIRTSRGPLGQHFHFRLAFTSNVHKYENLPSGLVCNVFAKNNNNETSQPGFF